MKPEITFVSDQMDLEGSLNWISMHHIICEIGKFGSSTFVDENILALRNLRYREILKRVIILTEFSFVFPGFCPSQIIDDEIILQFCLSISMSCTEAHTVNYSENHCIKFQLV